MKEIIMQWLKKIFGEQIFGDQIHIDCARCLHEISLEKSQIKPDKTIPCPECKFNIPPEYAIQFQHAYPVYIQLFGWSRVGKTTFLDVLRLMLYGQPLWPDFTCDPITELDFNHRQVLRSQRKNGEEPKSTVEKARDQNEPYIMLLNDMNRWKSRFLVMMDHAGEQFQTFEIPTDEIPFLQHCPTTIMLCSLAEDEDGKYVDDLMTTYVTSLRRFNVDFQKTTHKIVVVLSKADSLSDLPANLVHYFSSDETWGRLEELEYPEKLQGAALGEYIEVMNRVSNSIEEWFSSNVPGGKVFLATAKRNNIELRFSLVSSQGQELSGDVALNPKRVLDPFFFALDFQSK